MVSAAMKLKDPCSLEENPCQYRQRIIKQRHYFPDKGPPSQSYGFYGCESWTIKKVERQRIDALELWCWEDS